MSTSTPQSAGAVFAANRAHGRVALSVSGADGVTRLVDLREEGSARVRFPSHSGGAREAVLINTAGGIAGGDRFDTDVTVASGGDLVVTTAAAEKVYRALDAASEVSVALRVEAGSTLAWLPQETIVFDRARLERRIEVDAAENARFVAAEGMVLGRAAMGEAMTAGRIIDRWRVRIGGRLVHADALRLEGDIAATLSTKASANGAAAFATVLMRPANDEIVAAIRAREDAFRGEVGVSAWNGIGLARLVARDGAALRHDLAIVLGATGRSLPRLWLN